MGRTMPSECDHGFIYDWGDFGCECGPGGECLHPDEHRKPEQCPHGCNSAQRMSPFEKELRSKIADEIRALRAERDEARKQEAAMFRRLSDQEKYNIQSRRALCEQNDRFQAERDALQRRVDSALALCGMLAREATPRAVGTVQNAATLIRDALLREASRD